LLQGGDVLKFAGDALIVMFAAEDGDSITKATRRATQCALEIQQNHGKYTSTEVDFALSCHIGISAGTVHAIHVGGVDGRWEFLVAGDPFRQLEV
jgi:class 3 adenylate cyclase